MPPFRRLGVFLCASGFLSSAWASDLEVRENDSIVIIGNTFADRMHLFGYFETFLHCRFPEHRLRVRNLGWPADEVDKRIRPHGFPRLFDDLKANQADLILVCYGMNESFLGLERLDHFRQELEKIVGQLMAEKFNGVTPPRVALVTPIAQEAMPSLPDVSGRNAVLKEYAEAVIQVATKHGIPVADLFSPTAARALDKEEKLTFNGIHLTENGYRVVSQLMAEQFGLLKELPATSTGAPDADAFRRLVYEKNYWHQIWWHPPNASYLHGRRNEVPGSKHLTRERKQSSQLVEDMDRAIWKAAKPGVGEVWKTIPLEGRPVWFPTPRSREISGDGPEALWAIKKDGKPGRTKSPKQEQDMMTVAPGYQVNL
ncbi:MAG: SGNH/GDSL hydrolase family protein, partial [Opitutales bacterium]